MGKLELLRRAPAHRCRGSRDLHLDAGLRQHLGEPSGGTCRSRRRSAPAAPVRRHPARQRSSAVPRSKAPSGASHEAPVASSTTSASMDSGSGALPSRSSPPFRSTAATRSSTARSQADRVGSHARSSRCPPGSSSRSWTTTPCPRGGRRRRGAQPGRPGAEHDDLLRQAAGSSEPSPQVASRPVAGLSTQATSTPRSARPTQTFAPTQRVVSRALARLAHEVRVGEVRARHRRRRRPRRPRPPAPPWRG